MRNDYGLEPNYYTNDSIAIYPDRAIGSNQNPMMPNWNFNTTIQGTMLNMNSNMNTNQNSPFLNSYEGYIRGNLFANLYDPYKNYQPNRLIPNSEQAEMLLAVNELTFASHELRLYLDVFPEDRQAIALFNQYRQAANEAIQRYEEKFGPMEWNALSDANRFSWEQGTWPWEMGVM